MADKAAVLLIGNTKSKSTIRLKEEAVLLGIRLDLVSLNEVYCSDDGVLIEKWTKEVDVWSYDSYFFRGIGKKAEKLTTFINLLKSKNKRVVEKALLLGLGFPEDKFVSPSKEGLYLVPKSKIIHTRLLTKDSDIVYPKVFKKIGPGSSMGRGVALVNSFDEVSAFCSDYDGDLQIQDLHNIEYDIRVLVVGGKCLGGFLRYKKEDTFLTTVNGGPREVANLTSIQMEAAVEAAALQGLEIAGVDMFFDDGEVYIFEVNASPQFSVFEKVTGVNVAKSILEFLTSK
jgi:glutathione synthase/RimK-type ligase-like ATP-grasp enzyme